MNDPQYEPITTQRTDTSPLTSTEYDLVQLWSTLLGGAELGIADDFFALGGNSFIATRLIARIRVVFGVEVTLRMLLEHPTIARLAQVIDQQEKLPRPIIIKRSGRRSKDNR